MKAESARQIKALVELEKFNPETLCPGESWMWMSAPSANENPARPVWCSPHCWLGGNAVRRTGLAGFKAFPDTSENESSLVLVAETDDMREVVIVFPE